MNKSTLKAEFINAKIKDAKYIGVSIKTEGSSQPEIIINPRENFDAKFDYYMEAYDDDLILIAAKGKKDIHIVAAGHGNRFEDIENQLIGEKGKGWRELIAGAIDKAYDRMIEQAADKATVNKGITEKKEYKKPEIKAKTTAEQFVEAVMQTGVTAEQVKTAIMKMSGSQGCTNRRDTNNWRKMHGLPMRRKQKARRKHERGKGADSH